MDTNSQKNDPRIQLNRRQLTEWNELLSAEIRHRIALDDTHQQDHSQAYLDEINFHDRALLATTQLQAIRQLIQQHRTLRITMQKRHAQERDDLTKKSG